MKIYEVKADVGDYQSIGLQNEEDWASGLFDLECRPLKDIWNCPGTFIIDPMSKRGNFFYLTPGALVFNKVAYDKLGFFFEWSGEILTLPCEDEDDLYLLNVLECYNVLDKQKTKWRKPERRKMILEYAFHRNRMSEAPLFKIPETCRVEILTFSGMKNPDDEFITAYHNANLTGLKFIELWTDEN